MNKYVVPVLIRVIGINLFSLTPFSLDQCLCLSFFGSIVLFVVSLSLKDRTSMTPYTVLLVFTSRLRATPVSQLGQEVLFLEDIVNRIGLCSDLFKFVKGIALVMMLIPVKPNLTLLLVRGLFLCVGFKLDKDPFIFSEGSHLLLKINKQSSLIRKDFQKAYLSICKTFKKNKGMSMPKLKIRAALYMSVKDWDIFVSGKRIIGGNFAYESELIRSFESLIYSLSYEVVSIEYLESLLNDLGEVYGWFTDQLIPKKISRDCLTLRLRSSVKEQVSLDLFFRSVEPSVLYSRKQELGAVVEYVRKRLGSFLGESVLRGCRVVRAVILENSVEKMIQASNILNSLIVKKILDEVDFFFKHAEYDEMAESIIVTGFSVCCAVRKIMESRFLEVPILAYGKMAAFFALRPLMPISDQVLISCGLTLKSSMTSLIRT